MLLLKVACLVDHQLPANLYPSQDNQQLSQDQLLLKLGPNLDLLHLNHNLSHDLFLQSLVHNQDQSLLGPNLNPLLQRYLYQAPFPKRYLSKVFQLI